MELNPYIQTTEFLLSAASGVALGAVYDLIGLLRRLFKSGIVLNALFDSLFVIICALYLIFFVMTVCGGELRLFMLAGFALGAVVYTFTLGKVLRNVFGGNK